MPKIRKSLSPAKWSIALATGLSLAVVTPLARADTLSELKAQIDALQKKVGELENAQKKSDEETQRKVSELQARNAREFINARRAVKDGREGNLNRLQFGGQYSF